MSPEAVRSCAASVQALVFETGNPDFPYSVAGTGFLVGYEGRCFAITARHLLRPDELTPLCFFPTDASRRLIPLRDLFYIPQEKFDEDFTDFAVIEIDMPMLDKETGEGTVINLALADGDWLGSSEKSSFVVIGYPAEHSEVDYENGAVLTQCFALHGHYAGVAASRFLHEVSVQDSVGLTHFRGFSGSPVFSWMEYEPGMARIALCGMAVQGTVESMRIRFIEWQVIEEAIRQKIKLRL